MIFLDSKIFSKLDNPGYILKNIYCNIYFKDISKNVYFKI